VASVASLLAAVACFAGTHGSAQLVTVQAAPRATTGSLTELRLYAGERL
jgi:hypothetical protein